MELKLAEVSITIITEVDTIENNTADSLIYLKVNVVFDGLNTGPQYKRSSSISSFICYA